MDTKQINMIKFFADGKIIAIDVEDAFVRFLTQEEADRIIAERGISWTNPDDFIGALGIPEEYHFQQGKAVYLKENRNN